MTRDSFSAVTGRAAAGRIAAGLASFLAILLFAMPSHAASCSGMPKQITFANWAAAETATAAEVTTSVAAFEKANPCIHVKMIAIPFADMVSQLTVMTIGNNTPDVMEFSSGMPQALAAEGALADLRPFVDKALTSDIQPSMLQDGEANGKLVALPLSLTPHGFWYNKGLMKKAGLNPADPPKTISVLTHDIELVKSKEPNVFPFAMMTSKGAYTVVVMWPWLLSARSGAGKKSHEAPRCSRQARDRGDHARPALVRAPPDRLDGLHVTQDPDRAVRRSRPAVAQDLGARRLS